MYSSAGRRRADGGHTGLKQGNVRQKSVRQRGLIVRKDLRRRKIDYEQQERKKSNAEEKKRRKHQREKNYLVDEIW